MINPIRKNTILFLLTCLCAVAIFSSLASANTRDAKSSITVYLHNHRYFQKNGKPFFFIGYYNWTPVVEGDTTSFGLSLNRLINLEAKYHLNYIRVNLELENIGPFKSINGKIDLDQWNHKFWGGLKQHVRYAASKGVNLNISIFDGWSIKSYKALSWPSSFWNVANQTKSFYGNLDPDHDGADEMGGFYRINDFLNNTGVGFYQKKLIDKVTSELAPYDNTLFEVANEPLGSNKQWNQDVIKYIRTKTNKAITANINPPAGWSDNNPDNAQGISTHVVEMDGHWHSGKDTALQIRHWVKTHIGNGRPVWYDPDGSNLGLGRADANRRAAWYSLVGGAAGYGGFESDIRNGGADIAKLTYYKYLMDFLSNTKVPYWTMSPQNELISDSSKNSLLARKGRDYLAYIWNDSTATIQLATGTYYYQFYNPQTGQYSAQQAIMDWTGGGKTFNKPSGYRDWVVYVYSSSNPKSASPQTPASDGTDVGGSVEAANSAIGHVGLYNVYEKTFTDPTSKAMTAAKKSGQKMTVTFIKGKHRLTLPGFWAGQDQWKFRASLPQQGTWHWVVSAPGRSFDGEIGSIDVVNSSNKGFLHPNPNYPHTVSYSRKNQPVFLWGNTAYDIVKQVLEGHTATWHKFIKKSKEYGMSHIRFLVAMWNYGGYRSNNIIKKYSPWLGTFKHPNYKAFNVKYWRALDKLVQYLHSKDMVADIILFTDAKNVFFNMTPANEKRYVKYIVARYAAYTNVTWCITNEWSINNRKSYIGIHGKYMKPGFTNPNGNVTVKWVNFIGNMLYKMDPYIRKFNRLTSVHNTGNHGTKNSAYRDYNFLFSGEPWATYEVFQFHNGGNARKLFSNPTGDDWGHFIVAHNWDNNVPIFDDEYGYESDSVGSGRSRRAGWGIAIAGGYGVWGDNTGGPNGKHPGDFGYAEALKGIWYGNAKTPQAIKVMTDIFRNLPFWKMTPHDNLIVKKWLAPGVHIYLLAQPGLRYLMYVVNTWSGKYRKYFTIKLPTGTYHGKWISTTSGKTVETIGAFTTSGGNTTFMAPDFFENKDIVMELFNIKK